MLLQRLSVFSVAAFCTAMSAARAQAAELPVACIAGSCGGAVPGFVQSGQAGATSVGNTLTVNQASERAILNWQSFNVSADGKVIFVQPGSSSIALNRIHQDSPSRIFGAIEANGQIYLVNQNGIVFGTTARVKTAGLVASTLNISDEVFAAGIVAPDIIQNSLPALASDGRIGVIDAQGRPVLGDDGKPLQIALRVEQGAEIATSGAGGRVVLASRSVENAGHIVTPDGQTIIAAGEKVYLQPSSDPNLRGLLVEVDTGGKAWNQITGHIEAARGNVTIAGLAVNQDGRVSATTTVAANGSIRLLGRDSVAFTQVGGAKTLTATHGGSVSLGTDSLTEVLPELTDKATAIDDQAQNPSTVAISAQQISLAARARILAPGGEVTLRAQRNPSIARGTEDAESRLRIDSGAVIDVSGSTASVAVERNLVTVELRANELRDAPLQRDGPLRGRAVVVDARVGTPLGDVSGALATLPRDIAERTSRGGTVSLRSEGDVAIAEGSRIDVSGGAIVYRPGVIQTSMLVAPNGQTVDIGHADPNVPYVNVVNPTSTRRFDRWGVVETLTGPQTGHYDPGYTEGRPAGLLQIEAPAMLLNGSFDGHATAGLFQRDAASVPAGGHLVLGVPDFTANGIADFRAPSIALVNSVSKVVVAPDASLPRNLAVELPIDFLTRGGFATAELNSNGTVTLRENTPLTMRPGSTLSVHARAVDIRSDITANSGNIALTADLTTDITGAVNGAPAVNIADGVTLDVRGRWQNDLLDPVGAVFRNGGSIDLAARSFENTPASLTLGDGVSLRASGGASLAANGTLTGGTGGSIALRSGQFDSALSIGAGVGMDAFGVQGARGGRFTLEARRITIGPGSAWAAPQVFEPHADAEAAFAVGSALFTEHGFSAFNLTATGAALSPDAMDALTLLAGTHIDARARTLEIAGSPALRPAAANVQDFSRQVLQPEYLLAPASIALRVDPRDILGAPIGSLTLEEGSVLTGAARSSFSFASPGGVTLAGQVYAMGGSISAQIPTPPAAFDHGFSPTLNLEVAPSARLDVSGGAVFRPSDVGLRTGEVVAGGNVNLIADRGSVLVRSGSSINLSGAASALDIKTGLSGSGYERQMITSAGGTLTVRAPESILLAGDLSAAAGSGSALRAPGGSLSIELTRRRGFIAGDASLAGSYPGTPRTIRVIPDAFAGSPGNGFAIIETSRIAGGGFDALHLETDGVLSFDAGVSLSLGRELRLESPIIDLAPGATTHLAAPYLALGPTLSGTPSQASAGAGSLELSGDFIDVIGNLAFQRADQVTMTSHGDLRLRGVTDVDGASRGSLRAAGEMTLNAERLYPTTITEFNIDAGPEGVLRIGSAGTNDDVPLSAGGSLLLSAREIHQGGHVLAPFGSIRLAGTDNVELLDGSVTSVAAVGALLPFGRVDLGEQWLYGGVTQDSIPERRVEIESANVKLASGASVDLRGGGDLYAYNWVPGTGGSRDVLDTAAGNGYYAILPSLRGQLAPFDPQEYSGSSLRPGDSVYLSASSGLAAGVYPLLPARYALLPGALLVRRVSGYTDLTPQAQVQLPDGSTVVAGYQTYGTSGLGETRFSGFALAPGTAARQMATYEDFHASTFFPARAERLDAGRAPLPADAGYLGLFASTSLTALGTVRTAAADTGRGALVDIAARRLEIGSGNAPASAGAVRIDANSVAAWNASSVLFGGRRTANGSAIESLADEILIDAGTQLSGAELIAVADSNITLAAGARMASTAANTHITDSVITLSSASGAAPAVLAVSNATRFNMIRTDSDPAAVAGRVTLAPQSNLSTKGTLLIDAASATLDGGLLAAGAEVDLSSRSLAFAPQTAALGITITPQVLQGLQSTAALRLQSSGSIDFLESVSLGSAAAPLDSISLGASSIRSMGEATSVTLTARSIDLGGGAGQAAPGLEGSGIFSLSATRIGLQPGFLDFDGFASVNLAARDALLAEGLINLRTPGALEISTPQLSVASGGKVSLRSAGDMSVDGAAAAAPDSTLGLGGSLLLSGRNLTIGSAILLPSGSVSLSADQRLQLNPSARVDVSGRQIQIADQRASSPGGTISLSAGGEILAQPGSMLALNGGDAAAGELNVLSPGVVRLAGNIAANSNGAAAGGSVFVDAGSLADFGAFAAALQSGGFLERREIRARSGDLALGADLLWTARHSILAADSGHIDIQGSMSGDSDNERSTLALFGGAGVSLGAQSSLRATGSGSLGRGGSILLAASDGSVDLSPGANIDVTGTHESGQLLVRAQALGNDMGIDRLGANVRGTTAITLEPTLTFTDVPDFLDAGVIGGYADQVRTFIDAAADTIRARLGSASGPVLRIQPGIDLRRDGDLQLGEMDFGNMRFAGEPAALTIRATGSIDVNGNLSDGLSGAANRPALRTDRSTTLRLVAGAALGAANPETILAGADSDLRLNNVVVRTGTGDLTLMAARDVSFNGETVGAYTMGVPGQPSLAIARGPLVAFPTGGGALSIRAGRDVVGSSVVQAVGDWQPRQGRGDTATVLPVRWGVDVSRFNWNAGTLGGGDLTVRAGRDVSNITAAAADSGYGLPGGQIAHQQGGVLSIATGGDLGSPFLHVTAGNNRIRVGGGLTRTRADATGAPLGALFSMQDARLDILARNGIAIESIFNPTVLVQPGAPPALSNSFFFTYGDSAAFAATSVAGDVEVTSDTADHIGAFIGVDNQHASDSLWLQFLPPSLSLRALSGDVAVAGAPTLFPADVSNLELFAARDIRFTAGTDIKMSDAVSSSLPSTSRPQSSNQSLSDIMTDASQALRHLGDYTVALVSAGRDLLNGQLQLSKPARIQAGRDIRNFSLLGQNLRPTDQTLLSAGRDLVMTSGAFNSRIELSGPGRLDLLAARNIDLGFSSGISTTGNLLNSDLPDEGAAITAIAGFALPLGATAFIEKVVTPSTSYQELLVRFVEQESGVEDLSYGDALTRFQQFSADRQRPLLVDVFFRELVLAGREANTVPGSNFERGYAAIDSLLAGSRDPDPENDDHDFVNPYAGDLKLAFSRIYTLGGGDISLLVPGGIVDVGLAVAPALGAPHREPADLGIVAQRSGDVRIYASSDVLVNASRVFTLGGGDIAIWSTRGDIDAGRGAKSAISAPAPTVLVNSSGQVVIDFAGAVAGSGIRAILTDPSVKPGDVDLIAPAGIVNAGDAGIGSAGNLNVAAQQVVGLDNIQVGGASSGVPAETSNLGASLSGVSAVSSGAANSAQKDIGNSAQAKSAPLADNAVSWLDVFVEGFGEEVCKPSDNECLQRQKAK